MSKNNRTRSDRYDMLNGTLWDKILMFALPLAASSVLQQLFNSADMAVVGRFAGSNSLAAVGANGAITHLMITLFLGLSTGTNVILSAYLGKGDRKYAKKTVHTSIVLSIISGIFLAVVGVLFARPILSFMSTPDEILDLASVYFRICFAGMPFNILYNFEASILRSKGDTKRPLITLIVAGGINLALNLFFVVGLHLDVAGVALATVIANVFSSAVLFVLLLREEDPIRLIPKDLELDLSLVGEVASIGIPAGLQGAMFSLANVIIQTAINGLGPAAIAGSQAGNTAESFAFFILISFANASITFIGQNRGAGRFDRCRRVAYWCYGMSLIATMSYCFLLRIFEVPIVSVFSSDPEVIEYAVRRINVICLFEFLNLSIEILSGCMRGYGKSMLPTIICIFGVCVFRVIWVYTAFAATRDFNVLMMAYPISWAIATSGLIVGYFKVRSTVERQAGYVHKRGREA